MGEGPMSTHPAPRAIVFDVFGTCVDWRTSIVRAGEAMATRLGLEPVDWAALADDWRAQYQPRMQPIRDGRRAWVNLDELHRESLDDLLPAFGLGALPEAERREFTMAWHRLDPWPDTVLGLTRLKRLAPIAPLSNGHIALQENLARWAGLPWDAILGAEIARAYKPRPEVYLRGVEALGLGANEVMMVAAHNDDLKAAAASGLQTAFVPRPHEHGPGQTADLAPTGDYDLVAADFLDLADRLHCRS